MPTPTRRPAAREPLLLLHGIGLTRRCWAPVLPALERVHDEVLAPDLPGFGAAPPLARREPTVAALCDAVEAQLDAAGHDTVHVAGNSLGGWMALELARRGRARTVVALAPAGLELMSERAYQLTSNLAMRARARAAAPAASALTRTRAGRTALLGPLRGRPWRVTPSEAAAEVRDFARAPGFLPTLRATIGGDVATGLRGVRVPARMCFGTHDALLAQVITPRFALAVPGAQLRMLPGCGHVPMADDPGYVAASITEITAPGR
jgi:pimeloyl-ACP methyl ester carboxylesterase